MKKIFASASVFLVLVLTLMLPISAAANDTDIYYFKQAHYSSAGTDAFSAVSYPGRVDLFKPGTRFQLTLSDIESYSTTDGVDSRFFFSFFQEGRNGVSSVFIDFSPRAWDASWTYDNGYCSKARFGYYDVTAGKNIILGEYIGYLGEKLISVEAVVSGTRYSPSNLGSFSQIRPEDITLLTTRGSNGTLYDYRYLTPVTLTAADQSSYNDFMENLSFTSYQSKEYNGTYGMGYHVRADHWGYDLTVVVDEDPAYQQALDFQRQLQDKQDQITQKDQQIWEQGQTLDAQAREIRRLEQIQDAYNRYMEMTDQGEKSIFAGFIDSIGNTLWTGVSMIFDIEVFDFTLGQIIAGAGIIAVLYVILKLITGGGSGK